jgi:hypothetical protein
MMSLTDARFAAIVLLAAALNFGCQHWASTPATQQAAVAQRGDFSFTVPFEQGATLFAPG